MNKKLTEYQQLVIDIITAKADNEQIWKRINFIIDWAVCIAKAKLETLSLSS